MTASDCRWSRPSGSRRPAPPARSCPRRWYEAWARGRGGHEFRMIGSLDLKGLAEPLDVDEVVWEPVADEVDRRPGLPPLLATPNAFGLAGREAELSRLTEAWKRSCEGPGHLVLLSGEPGIGKTRLVAELAATVVCSGGIVLAGATRTSPPSTARVVDALGWWTTATGPGVDLGEWPGELVRLLPDLAILVPALADAVRPGDSPTRRSSTSRSGRGSRPRPGWPRCCWSSTTCTGRMRPPSSSSARLDRSPPGAAARRRHLPRHRPRPDPPAGRRPGRSPAPRTRHPPSRRRPGRAGRRRVHVAGCRLRARRAGPGAGSRRVGGDVGQPVLRGGGPSPPGRVGRHRRAGRRLGLRPRPRRRRHPRGHPRGGRSPADPPRPEVERILSTAAVVGPSSGSTSWATCSATTRTTVLDRLGRPAGPHWWTKRRPTVGASPTPSFARRSERAVEYPPGAPAPQGGGRTRGAHADDLDKVVNQLAHHWPGRGRRRRRGRGRGGLGGPGRRPGPSTKAAMADAARWFGGRGRPGRPRRAGGRPRLALLVELAGAGAAGGGVEYRGRCASRDSPSDLDGHALLTAALAVTPHTGYSQNTELAPPRADRAPRVRPEMEVVARRSRAAGPVTGGLALRAGRVHRRAGAAG